MKYFKMVLIAMMVILTFGAASGQVVIKARIGEPGYRQESHDRQWRHRQWQRRQWKRRQWERNHRHRRMEDQH